MESSAPHTHWLAAASATPILAILYYNKIPHLSILFIVLLAALSYLYATRQLRQTIVNHEASIAHFGGVTKRYKDGSERHEDEMEGPRTISRRHHQENLELKLEIEQLRAQLIVSGRAESGSECKRFHYEHPVAETNRWNLRMVGQVNAQARSIIELTQCNVALRAKGAASEELLGRLEKEIIRLRERVRELSAGKEVPSIAALVAAVRDFK